MGIKLFHKLLFILLINVLYVTSVFASFNTNIYCHVRGYVYYDGYDTSSLDRNDLCTMIYSRVEEDQIILWTDMCWVLVKIPEFVKGFTTFWYKWGSENVYINGQSVHIKWGYILRG